MFEKFVSFVEDVAEGLDTDSFPLAVLHTVGSVVITQAVIFGGLAVYMTRRINKFVDKVLNKDEGE